MKAHGTCVTAAASAGLAGAGASGHASHAAAAAMPAFCNLLLSLLFPLPCAHPIDFMSSRLCSLAVANSNLSKKLSHSGVRARSDALTGCSHSRVPTPRSRPMRCCNSPNHFFALQLHLHWRVTACRAPFCCVVPRFA